VTKAKQARWEMKFDKLVDSGYFQDEPNAVPSSYSDGTDIDLGKIKQFIAKELKREREGVEAEIRKIRKRFKCGKCDGAKHLHHSLWCIAITEISNYLKEGKK